MINDDISDEISIMSKEQICKTTLDNTPKQSKENFAHNSNATSVAPENILSPIESCKDETVKPELSKMQTILDDLDPEDEDYEADVMTGSYGEISLEQELRECMSNRLPDDSVDVPEDPLNCNIGQSDFKSEKRPDSLLIPKSSIDSTVQDEAGATGGRDNCKKCVHKSQQTSDSQATSVDGSPSLSSEEFALHSYAHRRNGSDTSGLSELQGTLTVDGDLVTFVAEDLQEKIKMSSPVSKWTESTSFPGSRSSTPSLYRTALQPSIQRIDPTAVADLESHAKKMATCVDTMLENLSGTLQSISSLTVDSMETFEVSVCKTCDAVDENIRTIYKVMAKCEELSNAMGPLYKIGDDVKKIKRVLDQLEFVVEHKS